MASVRMNMPRKSHPRMVVPKTIFKGKLSNRKISIAFLNQIGLLPKNSL
jgi:hypothetical protein